MGATDRGGICRGANFVSYVLKYKTIYIMYLLCIFLFKNVILNQLDISRIKLRSMNNNLSTVVEIHQ